MRKVLLAAAAIAALSLPITSQAQDQYTLNGKPLALKTRVDHLSGTPLVLVVSYLTAEITSITCEGWTMLGVGSWHHQNDFTIPAGPAIAILDASKYDGYCKTPNSIVAHTDEGDSYGVLDRGPGKWDASTKLTFTKYN